MEKFLIGALAGGIAGALIVSNNAKMRMLVKKGEDELKEKVGAMVDEKLSRMKTAAAGSQGGSQNEQNAQNAEETQSEETQSGEKQNKKKSRKKEAKNA